MSVLQFDDVTRTFGGIVAADGVNLAIANGELRCLIGPNGAGKSTLFKLAMGLLRPSSGHIRLDGHDITHAQPYARVRRGLAMKYQATRVFGELTVAQNINIAHSQGGEHEQLLDWALSRFQLDQKPDTPANELSYGEQHWLEMCMILGNGPKVVLMDEPTAGMTPQETHETAAFLTELNQCGVTVVVIEHDMGFVREIARKITVLHQGRVLREGPVDEIENDPEIQRIYLGEAA